MISFVFAVIHLVVVAPAFRTKSRRDNAEGVMSVAVMSKDDCSQLGSIGEIRGQPVGKVAELVCKFWPGENFPVRNATRVLNLIDYVAAEGGLWDKLLDLRKSREKNEKFCFRKEELRTVVPSNCEMTFNGTCYGACPSGYQPAGLTSAFAPVCTSVCSATYHPVGCGFGCANTFGNCLRTVSDQVTSVVTAIGRVSSYVFANPAIALVAEQVVEVVSFALTSLLDIVGYAKQIREAIDAGEQQVALVIMIFQILYESGLVQNLQLLSSMIGDTGKAIVELVEGGFSWRLPNLDRIADILLTNGVEILGSLYEVTKAFMYPRCEKAGLDAIFSLEDIADN